MQQEQKVFTSYWGNLKNVSKEGIVAIGICRYPPRGISGVKLYKDLAPTGPMLKGLKDGSMSKPEFHKKFQEHLDSLDPAKVLEDLKGMGFGKSIAILCYEKPPDSCHRHKVARWLEQKCDIKIEEVKY